MSDLDKSEPGLKLRSVRLTGSGGAYYTTAAPFYVGQVYKMNLELQVGLIEPHLEDAEVHAHSTSIRTYSDANISKALREKRDIFAEQGRWWEGDLNNCFSDTLVASSSGAGYIVRAGSVPDVSTGFWVPDEPVSMRQNPNGRNYYWYADRGDGADGVARLPYVGERSCPDIIEAGTVCRLSLARWWDMDGKLNYNEMRCYLQLSEVYSDR